MTRTTNARVAGFTFLFYIAAGITSLVLFSGAATGEGVASRLASIAQHETEMRFIVLLSLLTSFSALVLGVTLYAITRDQDRDLAMLGLACRVLEGVAHLSIARTLGLVWVATATGAGASNGAASELLGAFLLRMGAWSPGAIFFAVGSLLFSWLLLRGRMIPVPLAWLGVIASVLLVAILPMQLSGLFLGPLNWFGLFTWLLWLPMLVFEVVLAFWLIIKGVEPPVALRSA